MNNRFGTTSDMIIQTVQEKKDALASPLMKKRAVPDLAGYVDRPLADPNRYAGNRKDVAARLNALGLDAGSLLEQNQHRIPKITGESKRRSTLLRHQAQHERLIRAGSSVLIA